MVYGMSVTSSVRPSLFQKLGAPPPPPRGYGNWIPRRDAMFDYKSWAIQLENARRNVTSTDIVLVSPQYGRF